MRTRVNRMLEKFSFKNKDRSSKNRNGPGVYQKFFEIGKRLLAESEIDKLLTVAIDFTIDISDAERGMIILFEEEGNIIFQTARNLKKEDIDYPKFEISRTIINKVKAEGTPICLRNVLDDPVLRDSKSVARLKILSVICLPLNYEGKVFGVVYLDNRTVRIVFKHDTCNFANEFAKFISTASYNALERKQLFNRVRGLEEELRGKYEFESIIGHSPKMIEIMDIVAQVANTDATVLIQGETGTGKELVARALHYNSSRRDMPFITINCGALPEQLLESELFGHEKGAFTGAIVKKIGKFEAANGSTIFLDEVSEMSPFLQVKLLRILQSGEYAPVGSIKNRWCDVRVIAATNQNLKEQMKQGKFRQDLFYRLHVMCLDLPPLRERREDIVLLIEHFLRKFADELGKEKITISEAAHNLLLTYDYPGNVRELENIIRRAIILTKTNRIEPIHLPQEIVAAEDTCTEEGWDFHRAKKQVIENFERQYLTSLLKENRGVICQAARKARLDVKNLRLKLKKYGINPRSFANGGDNTLKND